MNDTDRQTIATCIYGLWPRLHNTAEGNLVFFGYATPDGTHKPGLFSGFPVGDCVEACRAFAIDHPGKYPSADMGRGWRQIKGALMAKRRATNPRQRMTWGPAEEIDLDGRRRVAAERFERAGCLLPPDWFDDLAFLRRTMAANPSGFEREEAEKYLNAAVEDLNIRVKERGRKWEGLRWPLSWWRRVPREQLAADWDAWHESNDAALTNLAKRACAAFAKGGLKDGIRGAEPQRVGDLF